MANVQRALRKALRRQATEASTGELNIVPFLDIVTNLMLFLLATTTFVATVSEVRADLPGYGPHRGETLNASVTLTDHGAVLATSRGRVGPDCQIATSGAATAPRTSDGFDFATLTRCASALHAAFPTEHSIILTADPNVPYRDLIGAMDAVREDESGPLFPDVQLSAGVR